LLDPPVRVEQSPDSSAERDLVRVMLLHPELVERVVEEVARVEVDEGAQPEMDMAEEESSAGVIRDPVYAQIFRAVSAAVDSSPEALAEQLDPLEHHVVEELRAEPGAIVDPGRTIADSVRMLRARTLRRRLDEHVGILRLAKEADKPDLLRQEVVLQKELAAVGGREWRSVRRQVL
jgi:hypothetical protein